MVRNDNQRRVAKLVNTFLTGLSIISLLSTLSVNKNQNASAIVSQLYSITSSKYLFLFFTRKGSLQAIVG